MNGKVSQLDLSSICAANTNRIPTIQINDFHRDRGIVLLSLKTKYSIENQVFLNYHQRENQMRDDIKSTNRQLRWLEMAGGTHRLQCILLRLFGNVHSHDQNHWL